MGEDEREAGVGKRGKEGERGERDRQQPPLQKRDIKRVRSGGDERSACAERGVGGACLLREQDTQETGQDSRS